MKVKVTFFGSLVDMSGCSSMEVESAPNLNNLIKKLKAEFPFLEKASYAIAVNQQVIRGKMELKDNDEIALLPPFAGG